MKTSLSFFIALGMFALLHSAHGKVILVNGAMPAGGDGTSWPGAYRYLQDALAQTVAGDEVWVAEGTYYPDDGAAVTKGDRTATFTLKQDVKLYGGFAGGETIVTQRNPTLHTTVLSGEIYSEQIYWSLHVVTLSGNATLDGFTVTKGNANGDAAPYNQGGGIYLNSSAVLTARNCVFSTNTASSGGVICSYSYSPVTVTNCTFSGNTAGSGGAIYSSTSSSVTATNCTLLNNVATGTGSKGGAIYSLGKVKLFNNILWHTATQPQTNLIYITSTASISNAGVDFPSPSNLAKNLIKGGMVAITAESGAVVSLGDTTVTLLTADPQFINSTNPVGSDGIWRTPDDGLRLQANSPARDLGLSMYLPVDAYDLDHDGNVTEVFPVDLAGYDRIQGAAVDLGAYEIGDAFPLITITAPPVNQAVGSGTSATLTVAATCYDLQYQWYRGISGNTSNPVANAVTANLTTGPLVSSASFWVRVWNAFDSVDSVAGEITVTSDPIAGALNNVALAPFATGGNSTWFPQTTTTHDGASAMQSGIIGNSQASWFSASVEGGGSLSFWWKVSSQSSGDYLRFYIDGVLQTGSISGTTGSWAQKTFVISTPGQHALKWAYEKNASTVSGSDCGWVDEILWIPTLISSQPAGGNVVQGNATQITVSAAGSNLTYQWYEGSQGDASNPIAGATNPTFTTPSLDVTTRYWVRVGNGQGYEQSQTATVAVSPPSPSRLITLSGNLTFGSVTVNSTKTATMTISNTGNTVMTVSGITYPSGFNGDWSAGTIAAGNSQNVTVTFSPTAVQTYSGNLTVGSDMTSGTNTAILSGEGIAPPTPYATWQGSKFTTSDIATGLTIMTADFDGDGTPNLVEYAFATDPITAAASPVAVNISENNLQISFPRDETCTDITYTVQSSSTLATNSWTDIAQSTGGAATVPLGSPTSLSAVSETGTGLRTVTVTDSTAIPAGGKRFLRVKVTAP